MSHADGLPNPAQWTQVAENGDTINDNNCMHIMQEIMSCLETGSVAEVAYDDNGDMYVRCRSEPCQ